MEQGKRFLLHLPKELHKLIKTWAAMKDVSMNQAIVTILQKDFERDKDKEAINEG